MNNKTKSAMFAVMTATILMSIMTYNAVYADSDRQQKIDKLGTAFEKVYLKYLEEDNPKAKKLV